jgi:hypothetical protein
MDTSANARRQCPAPTRHRPRQALSSRLSDLKIQEKITYEVHIAQSQPAYSRNVFYCCFGRNPRRYSDAEAIETKGQMRNEGEVGTCYLYGSSPRAVLLCTTARLQ